MRLLLTTILLLASTVASAAEFDAKALVDGWVATIRDGGGIYPGGRQREIMKKHATKILPRLIEAFADENPSVGRQLSKVAALAPRMPGEDILRGALNDEPQFTREFAVLALGRMRSDKAVPFIVRTLREGLVSLESVTTALADIQSPAAEQALIALLGSYTPRFRKHAALSLGRYSTRAARKALLSAAGDEKEIVRVAAIEALGSAGDSGTVSVLEDFLGHEEEALRLAAVDALRRVGGKAARQALAKHFSAKRGLRLECLVAAIDLGEPVKTAAEGYALRVLGEDDPTRRAAALDVLMLAKSAPAKSALLKEFEKNDDAECVFRIARVLLTRGTPEMLPRIRGLLDRFPEHRGAVLDLLDLAADPDLPDRLRTSERPSGAPAGGDLARLAFHANDADVTTALELARSRPEEPGLQADAYLLVAMVGGPKTVDSLVKRALRLPPEDRIVVPDGPARPGLRHLHMLVLRALTGRAFGYAPRRPDSDNRNAMRRALKWWRTTDGSSARSDPEEAAKGAEALLDDPVPYRRESALVVLARAGKRDAVHRRMLSDPSPAVRIRAARLLVEAGDARAVPWLLAHFGDADLVDWAPFIESPRPTRLEAARAIWRGTNRRFDYVGEPLEAEWNRDLALEDSRRFRESLSAVKRGNPERWLLSGFRLRGITLGKGKSALRTLADVLAGEHPRFVKENALARLRRVTGKSVIAISIPDLELLAPGETHPVFAALSWRWREIIDG